MPVLLVIDDEPLILECFRHAFPEPEVTVLTATNAAEGFEQFTQQRPDVVILDIGLPDMSGLQAFCRFQELDTKVPVILITGQGTAATAIEAMRLGAYEYAVKPIDPDHVCELVTRAFEISRLMRVPAQVADAGPTDETADVLVGHCPAMQAVFKSIGRVAPQDVTVSIRGESGTGKELVARAIYHYSRRSAGRFLVINCAAIPETLLESELFGHEKGAFTGADRKRIGKFEQCDGGTLFLDEIGDLTPASQAKILRVLQDQQFERVGSNETIKCNVRLIAATNRDLERMMADGQFRGDLYYRLNVYTIQLPPLRERTDDLPLLVEHFLRRFSRELGKEVHSDAPKSLHLLQRYSWPGNVRELQSVLKQALLQSSGSALLPEFLPASIRGEVSVSSASASTGQPAFQDLTSFIQDRLQAGSTGLHGELLAATERHLLIEVLRHTGNNQSQAARILGITRATLRTKLSSLGLLIERSTSLDDDRAS